MKEGLKFFINCERLPFLYDMISLSLCPPPMSTDLIEIIWHGPCMVEGEGRVAWVGTGLAKERERRAEVCLIIRICMIQYIITVS